MAKNKLRDTRTEAAIQCEAVSVFGLKYPHLERLLFHIPNGGARRKSEAGKFKAMGVRAGVPGLMLAQPSGGFCGLFIEMKRPGEKLRDSQLDYKKMLTLAGYYVADVSSTGEFLETVNKYLTLPNHGK